MDEGHIHPSGSGLAAFAKAAADRPIQMLNFLRFRDIAVYPEGHVHAGEGWSGQRAYQQYGQEIAGPFARANAKVVWQNTVHGTVIGPDDEAWDAIFVVEYPSPQAMQTMISDPEYLAGAVNRTAALADSRLYLTQPGQDEGEGNE